MATSTNKAIQKLMDEVQALKDDEENIEEKLQEIARRVAAEKNKVGQAVKKGLNVNAPVDPQDAFQCEGCQ